MTIAEILEELPKLTAEERAEIRLKLAEFDGDEWDDAGDPLTHAEKTLIIARVEEHERNPGSAISLEEFNARLRQRLGG
jgi:putative addiction module component (TIGR02574 family)